MCLALTLSISLPRSAFQVNTGSALAIRYNDSSVLENHHAATGYALLDACGVLAPLSAEERRSLRRTLVDAVLATDMVRPMQAVPYSFACNSRSLCCFPSPARASTRTC